MAQREGFAFQIISFVKIDKEEVMKKAKRALAIGLSAALCLGAVGAIAGCGGSGI